MEHRQHERAAIPDHLLAAQAGADERPLLRSAVVETCDDEADGEQADQHNRAERRGLPKSARINLAIRASPSLRVRHAAGERRSRGRIANRWNRRPRRCAPASTGYRWCLPEYARSGLLHHHVVMRRFSRAPALPQFALRAVPMTMVPTRAIDQLASDTAEVPGRAG